MVTALDKRIFLVFTAPAASTIPVMTLQNLHGDALQSHKCLVQPDPPIQFLQRVLEYVGHER